MKSPRLSPAIALLALSPFGLTGCEQPDPGVTAWSGTSSEHVEALCWQPAEHGGLTPGECAVDLLASAGSGAGIAALEVSPGGTVGISVDRVVAESGWSVQIAGQDVATGLEDTYYRFTFPEQVATDGPGYTLQVIADATPNGTRGYWFIQLVPR